MGIEISKLALEEINRIIKIKEIEGWGLRLGVKGGGCSGFSYMMDFEEESKEHDKIFSIEDIQVFVDPKSYLYINGMTLDYSTELIGGGFQFINPNASSTCSCGQSFNGG